MLLLPFLILLYFLNLRGLPARQSACPTKCFDVVGLCVGGASTPQVLVTG
jgi:hypothetical protein